MNRRSFLGALLTATAGAAVDPEKLLWVPGQKKIFLPAPPPLMFHKDAFTLMAKDLDTGLSVRMIRAYDLATQRLPQSYYWWSRDGQLVYIPVHPAWIGPLGLESPKVK